MAYAHQLCGGQRVVSLHEVPGNKSRQSKGRLVTGVLPEPESDRVELLAGYFLQGM